MSVKTNARIFLMTQANKEMLHYLANLARIAVDEDEEASLIEDLSKILHHIEQLDEVDTENVEPCTYVTQTQTMTPLREDVVSNTLSSKFFLENSPEKIGGMVRVPTVLKQD